MRNYHLNIDRLVNQLMPHYLGGRNFILYMQSILSPINTLVNKWDVWSKEKYVESAMTSQVFLFEHFLTQRFQKYFADPNAKISISDTKTTGEVLYWKYVKTKRTHLPLFFKADTGQTYPSFYYEHEPQEYSRISFIVHCPKLDDDKIKADKKTVEDITTMLAYFIQRYRIASKTYKIMYIN